MQDGEKEAFGGDEAVPTLPGGGLGAYEDLACRGGESFEHHFSRRSGTGQRPACFLCTDCRRTSSASAISCQDQPALRALPTCSISRVSSSRRRASTARRPTPGSALPAAAASFVASLMVSM